jgi:hypothetical protein
MIRSSDGGSMPSSSGGSCFRIAFITSTAESPVNALFQAPERRSRKLSPSRSSLAM